MNFSSLIQVIQQTHSVFQQQAVSAINRALSIRNWLIGWYITEFGQKGEDRAAYGLKLREKIAEKITIKGLTAPELSRCRQFYRAYPTIVGVITQEFKTLIPNNILGLPTQESKPALTEEEQVHLKAVLLNISYTHLSELIKIEDQLKRRYYEMLILKTHPSVKESSRRNINGHK